MIKLALFDPYLLKFTDGMVKWWSDNGYEVKYDRYYNPQLAEWADVLWFDTCDNNLCSATNPGAAIMADDANYQPWDLHDQDMTGKKVIVRAIDIEVWQGHYGAAKWDLVDDLIFIAPHIRNLVDTDTLPSVSKDLKVHIIPCAVDLDKWTFKERSPGFDIAVVSERWCSKGTHLILQIALKLKQIDPRYKIHWLGQRSDYPWELAYFDEFIEHHQLNIEITNILNDGSTVDDFLDGKNYLLHASVKEGHSYAINEAMVKGIRPVAHRFYGADWLWKDAGILWDSIDEAIHMITEDHTNYNSQRYLDYCIEKGYTIHTMMDSIMDIVNG